MDEYEWPKDTLRSWQPFRIVLVLAEQGEKSANLGIHFPRAFPTSHAILAHVFNLR